MADDARSPERARAALGVGAQAGLAEIEAAFRSRLGPLSRDAVSDPAASDALRGLIEARATLRAALAEAARTAPPDPVQAETSEDAALRPLAEGAPTVRPRGFRLHANGRDVLVEIALDDLVDAARAGAVEAALLAPILRRCTLCAGPGRIACAQCGGAGVAPTRRMRAAPLDLRALAADRLDIAASPWSDAVGRGAAGGPLLRAVLV